MCGPQHAGLVPQRHAFRHIHALFFFFKTDYTKQYYILTKACQIIWGQ